MERAKGKMPRKQNSITFVGDLGELKALLDRLGYRGRWLELDENGKNVFRSDDGALLNWWATTKTLHCQGRTGPRLQEAVSSALTDSRDGKAQPRRTPAPSATSSEQPGVPTESDRVFVVHGHDREAREQLELVLRRLELDPFVLANTGGQGLTIIEALEKEISSPQTRRFGIVLLTPDDRGYRSDQGPESAEPRARQKCCTGNGHVDGGFRARESRYTEETAGRRPFGCKWHHISGVCRSRKGNSPSALRSPQ